MSATPSTPTPAGDDRNLVAVDPLLAVTFEDKMQLFWKKNQTAFYALCGLILLVMIAKEGWDYMARQKDQEVQKAYVAATTPALLKSFAAAQAGHPLGGIAYLRMADDAYKASKAAEAVGDYEQATKTLQDPPLLARAQLGLALAKVQAGKSAEGLGELKKLADDAGQLKGIRAESAYHLTSLAVESVNAVDAQKYVDQLMQIDASSQWTQRAMSLRASLPIAPAPVSVPAKDAPAAGVDFKVPGK